MSDEPRHCVYCRDAGRECTMTVRADPRQGGDGEPDFHVACLTCDARGPRSATEEEAATAWNDHTASVVQGLENSRNLDMLISLAERWKQRALASAAFADDLATLLKEVTRKIGITAPLIAAKHAGAMDGAEENDKEKEKEEEEEEET